jgi:hypothetical protein
MTTMDDNAEEEAREAVQRSLDWQDNGGPHDESRR